MNTNKATARIVGALFLTVMATYMIGAFVFIDPLLNSPDYLANASSHKGQMIAGVLLELLNGVAYVGIAILVFPVFRKFNESMAFAYLGFRIIEFVLQIVSDIQPLSILSLSQDFVSSGEQNIPVFQALGNVLLAKRYWANELVFLFYGLGAIIFYYVLYRIRLTPRFIAIWGLIGAPLVLINTLAEVFDITSLPNLGFIMGLNEIFLGVWLIIKGFSPPVYDLKPVTTDP